MIIVGIAVIVLLYVFLLNMRYDVSIIAPEHTDIQDMSIIKLAVLLVIGIELIIFTQGLNGLKLNKNVKRAIIVVSVLVYVAFQLVWILQAIVEPGADQGIVYGTAKLIFCHGDVGKENILKYFGFYKQNIGIVAFFELFMQIFRTDNVTMLRCINIVSNVFTIIGLYWLYKNLNDNIKQNKLLFFVLILGFIPISILSTWVYGDFIGLALSIWSIVFMVKSVKQKKIYFAIYSSLCMSVAIITRSNSTIFVIAMTMYLLFTLKEDKEKRDKLIKLSTICIFLAISFIPNKILEGCVSNKYKLNERKEKSVANYIYMGMSEGDLANGWYNSEVDIINQEMRESKKDDKTLDDEVMRRLKERIKYLVANPGYTYEFYRGKILSMWAEPTMACDVYNLQRNVDMSSNKILTVLFEEKTWDVIKSSQKILDFIIYGGALCYVILRRKDISDEMLLLVICFLGGFAFHLIWEAKSRYIIPYVVILIPVAVSGIDELFKNIRLKAQKRLSAGERVKVNEKSISSRTNVLRGRSSK